MKLILPMLLLALQGSLWAGGLPSEKIRGFYLDCWKTLRQDEYAKIDAFISDGAHLASAAQAAAADARTAEWTGDKSYLASAAARLKEISRRGLKTNEADFFTSFPFTWAYARVAEAGFADEELKELARNYAESKFKLRDKDAIFNQTFIRACGLAMAAKTWPQSSMATEWRSYANAILDGFLKLSDTPENSTDYNAFDLLCPFLLADLLDRTEDLRKEDVKRYYERFLAQTSPAGFIPPYGDAGTAPKAFTPDWPIDNTWGFYVAAFERAGAFWKDPQFRWGADRLFQNGERYQRPTRDYPDVQELFYFSFAADWMDASLKPEMPPLHSQILVRTDQTGPGQPDKLLLAASHQSGSPFLLADIYARGAHAHENQPGAIVYYEYGDQPLLASLGYNSRNPEHADLTVLQPPGATFPFTDGLFQPGVWHETQLPTERMPLRSSEQPYLRQVKDAVLRVTGGNKGVEVAISKLELTGPSGHRIVLDPLEDPTKWTGGAKAIKGDPGLTWSLPKGVTFLNRTALNLDFDCREYPSIAVRWKLSNNDERARPLILRMGPGVDYKVCIPQLSPHLVSARAEARAGVQFGCISYTGWFTPGSCLTRQMVVFPDGMLIVRDVLLPGQDAAGQMAGQVWHFLPLAKPESGRNWFNTTGGKNDFLICLNEAPGRAYTSHTIDVWSKSGQQSICASEGVQPGQALVFTSVLIPHPHETPAAELASQVQITEEGGSARIRITRPTGDRTLELTDGTNWNVRQTGEKRP